LSLPAIMKHLDGAAGVNARPSLTLKRRLNAPPAKVWPRGPTRKK
jgi:hypothetical protein